MTHLNHFGGAMGRISNDATPFAHRDATFNVIGRELL